MNTKSSFELVFLGSKICVQLSGIQKCFLFYYADLTTPKSDYQKLCCYTYRLICIQVWIRWVKYGYKFMYKVIKKVGHISVPWKTRGDCGTGQNCWGMTERHTMSLDPACRIISQNWETVVGLGCCDRINSFSPKNIN